MSNNVKNYAERIDNYLDALSASYDKSKGTISLSVEQYETKQYFSERYGKHVGGKITRRFQDRNLLAFVNNLTKAVNEANSTHLTTLEMCAVIIKNRGSEFESLFPKDADQKSVQQRMNALSRNLKAAFEIDDKDFNFKSKDLRAIVGKAAKIYSQVTTKHVSKVKKAADKPAAEKPAAEKPAAEKKADKPKPQPAAGA